MSLHRYAPKRDDNEPEIRKRFAYHGWHTEQRSSAGGWDLDCYPKFSVTAHLRVGKVVIHVDVKDAKGRPTKAQVKKWTALHTLGIPVYVARTAADIDALVAGALQPWQPEPSRRGVLAAAEADASGPLRMVRAPTPAVYRRGTP